MEEEHIVHDDSIIKDEDLMSDSQFSGNGNDSSDAVNEGKQFLIRPKRQILSAIDDLADNVKNTDTDTETVTYIETSGVDPLNLEQICVPVDGDNVSWIGLSS